LLHCYSKGFKVLHNCKATIVESSGKISYQFASLSVKMPATIAVVGAGIIGLASALLLAEEGLHVSLIARELPGDGGIGWASPYAGATLIPPPEMGQKEMAKESIAWYQKLAKEDPSSGVRVSWSCADFRKK
jgi:ribulose 1,5-bisphosphate synthetase/thiazole synthase